MGHPETCAIDTRFAQPHHAAPHPAHRLARLATIILLGVLTALLLMGCTTHYSRKDVLVYLHETYPGVDFRLSAEPVISTGEDDYDDEVWHAKSDDGVSFVVVNDYHWGSEWVSNYLWDNYSEALLAHMAQNGLYLGCFEVEVTDGYGGFGDAQLVAGVETRADIEGAYGDLYAIWDSVRRDQSACADFGYTVRVNSPLRNRLSTYEVDDGDVSGDLGDLDDMTLSEFEKNYILECLDYRFEDRLADFTDAEIADAVEAEPQVIVSVSHAGEDGPWERCEGLGASRYGYGVSFGTLYKLLEREGMNPVGDPWHYSFVGADGATYEVSYDFYRDDPNDEDACGYWYLRNGEEVRMGAFYNHFGEKDVLSLTGINIRIGE